MSLEHVLDLFVKNNPQHEDSIMEIYKASFSLVSLIEQMCPMSKESCMAMVSIEEAFIWALKAMCSKDHNVET